MVGAWMRERAEKRIDEEQGHESRAFFFQKSFHHHPPLTLLPFLHNKKTRLPFYDEPKGERKAEELLLAPTTKFWSLVLTLDPAEPSGPYNIL